MKYLSHYIDDANTKTFDKHGAFFAFSDKQFEEGKKDGVKYKSLGSGLICPIETSKTLWEEISKNVKKGIAQDVKENGTHNIIVRELANHEASYTGNIDDTIEALKDYPISIIEIVEVFKTRNSEPLTA